MGGRGPGPSIGFRRRCAAEKETLVAFLDYLRESLVIKLQGLSDEQARTPMVPSGTSLLVLVKHLAMVEVGWFQFGVAGSEDPVPSGRLADDDTIEQVVSGYRRASARSNGVVAQFDDIEQRCVRAVTAPEPMSLRWVLVHMVEETARHAGHADILREQLDGTVGR